MIMLDFKPTEMSKSFENRLFDRSDRLLTSIIKALIGFLEITRSADWSENTSASKYGVLLHQPRIQDTRHVLCVIYFIIPRENGGVRIVSAKPPRAIYCTPYNHGVSTNFPVHSFLRLRKHSFSSLLLFYSRKNREIREMNHQNPLPKEHVPLRCYKHEVFHRCKT